MVRGAAAQRAVVKVPVPPFTINGVLPPFIGSDPAQISDLMSPYEVSVVEVITHFATSDRA